MGKTANKIIVNVDIQAQAEQLNKIINQSKQSLKSLSPQINSSQFTALENAFDKISKNAAALSTNLKTGLSNPAAFTTAEKNINKLYEDYASVINRIKGLGIDPAKIIPDFAKPIKRELDEMQKQLKTEGSKAGKEFGDNLQKALQQALSKGDVKGVKNLGKQAQAELTKANRSIISQTANIAKQYGTDTAGVTKKLQAEDALMAKLWTSGKQGRAEYEAKGGRAYRDKLQADLGITKQYDAYKTQHGKISNASAEYQKQAQGVQQLIQKIQQLETELQKMAGPAQQQAQKNLGQLANSTQQVKTQTDLMRDSLEAGNKSLDAQQQKMSQMSQLKSYFGYMFSATTIVMRMSQAVRNAIKDFTDLDKQLNEISIVTGKSMDELWGKFGRLNSTAQKYGVVTSDVVSVQKLYYQQGRSTAEVNELTGKTLTFAKISGLEFAEATEYMTAALNAYKISARDANIITDTYAALSMSAAVDANELAVAMSKVASLAALSGSDLKDTSAYLTKIIETTREAPETAGTALKTVIARFTAVNKLTADQKELLDEDYNFNNIEKALKTVGVAVKDNVGQMREFTDILDDLGPKWDSLDSNTKHYIATQAAGARQQSRFIALMDDWGRTQELMEVAADSAGTGAEQLELAMDSIETKTNQLKASWQSFYSNIINSDLIKFFIDFVKVVIDGLNSIMTFINTISGGITGISMILTIIIGTLIASIISKAIGLGKTFGQSFMAGYRAARDKSKATEYQKEVAEAYSQGVRIGRARALGVQVGEASLTGNKGTVTAGKNAFLGLHASAAGKGGAALGRVAAGAGKFVGTISSVISAAMPFILGALAAAAAVAIIASIVKNIDNKREKQAGAEVKGANKEIEKEIEKTESLTKNYTKALKLHRKGLARTKEETEEYQTILGELNETYPQIVDRTAEGLYTLTKASETFYQTSLKASRAAITAAHKRIADNAQLAGGAGIYVGEKATELNDEIKSMAAILSEQSVDYVKELGNSNFTVKVEDITKMSEQGLTREAINEFVASDYSTEEFKKLMNDYVDIVDEQGQADVNALGYRNKEALTWFNAINAQYGGNLIAELWKETFGGNVLKTEITNWEEFNEKESGVKIPDELVNSWKEQAETDRKIKVYGNAEGTVDLNNKDSIYTQYYDSYLDNLTTSQAETLLNSRRNVDAYGKQYWIIGNTRYTDRDKAREAYKKEAETNEVYQKASRKHAEDSVRSYVDEDIVNKYESYEKMYTNLPKQIRTKYEDYGKQITTAQIGANEQFTSFIDNLALSDNGFANSLKIYLQKLIGDRETLAQELIDKITAKGGDIDLDKAKKSGYTTADLQFLSESLDKTYSLYGETVSGSLFKSIEDHYDNILSKNAELKSAFSQVDFFDSESIATYGAQLLKYTEYQSAEWNEFESIIDNASNAIDRSTKSMGQVFSDAAKDVEALTKSFDMIEDGITGELKIEDAFTLLSNYGDIIDISDLKATGEGFKLNIEDSTELAEKMLQLKIDEYRIEEALVNLKKEELKSSVKKEVGEKVWTANEGNFETYIKLFLNKKNWNETDRQQVGELRNTLSQAGLLTAADQFVSLSESAQSYRSIVDLLGKQTIKVNNGMKELVDKLTTLTDLLSKIGEYSDIDSYIDYLETDNAQQEFIRDFSTDKDVVSGAIKQQFTNYGNLVNANLTKAKRATENTATRRQSLEEQYGNFENYGKLVNFDEHGNVQLEDANIKKWAEDIAEMGRTAKTDAEKEAYKNEKKRYDLFFERIEGYKEEHSLIAKSTQDAQKYIQAMEEFNKTLKQDVKNMEDKFLDLFIKRDEEALESLKERYDAMKKMDEDYLNSVKEAVEKERELRNKTNEENDLIKLQKKLELLRMSGGSATEIQSLEEEIKEKTQNMVDARVDSVINEQEKITKLRQEEMDEEVLYQEQVLEAKKENMILYNQEIAELMKQDKETIMNTWRSLDTDFQKSTETNKQLLEADMDAMVTKGLAAKESLANNYIPAIEDAYKNLKGEIGKSDDALTDFADNMKEIGDENGEVVKSIDNITKGYLNVRNILKQIIDMQPQLDNALKTGSEYKELTTNTDQFNFTNTDVDHDVTPNDTTYKFKHGDYRINKNHFIDKGTTESGAEKDLTGGDLKNLQISLWTDKDTVIENPNEDTISDKKVKASEIYNPRDGISWVVSKNLVNENNITVLELIRKNLNGTEQKYYMSTYDFAKWFSVHGYDYTVAPKFKTGGMVDFTGPAWVDGTPSKPEAFLSANDTSLIASLRDVLRVKGPYGLLKTQPVQKAGDTYYEIHINVDELGDGYSVDDLMNELEDRIVQSADKNTVIKISR